MFHSENLNTKQSITLGGLGLNYYFTDNWAINASTSYRSASEKGAYNHLQHVIGVSYNFGEITNLFSNIRVGFTATNPFNWTTGLWDPETTGSGIGTQNGFSSGGFYYGTESAPRTFITSIRFEF